MLFSEHCYTSSSKYLHKKIHIDILPTNAHIFWKQVLFVCKVLKLRQYSSVTLHVSPKTPISEGSEKIT